MHERGFGTLREEKTFTNGHSSGQIVFGGVCASGDSSCEVGPSGMIECELTAARAFCICIFLFTFFLLRSTGMEF